MPKTDTEAERKSYQEKIDLLFQERRGAQEMAENLHQQLRWMKDFSKRIDLIKVLEK